ncbi:MAG: hypothetical protein EPN14_09235 [Gallionella sp.]|nr:MAG: hypothetical protein EPN14_09235 [Gallionella sp.]
MARKTISLEETRPGMQLAVDVCDANGGILLAAGAVLSEAALAALARRGVTRLAVAEAISPEERARRIAEIDQRLDALFRHAGNDPLLRKLRETVREFRVGEL